MGVVAMVGPRLCRIGLLMESERHVYGPVVEWLVSQRCSDRFGVARSRFVLVTRCSVTVGKTSAMHADVQGVTRRGVLVWWRGGRCGDDERASP